MSKGTDLRASGAQSLTDEQKTVAAGALAQAAGTLAADDPNGPVYSLDFAALVGAKVYGIATRDGVRGGVDILRLATDAVGEMPTGTTRAVFAVQVAKAAGTLGYDWSADDNRRLAAIAVGQ